MRQQTPNSGEERPRCGFVVAGLILVAVAGCRNLAPAAPTDLTTASLYARAQTPDDADAPGRELPFDRARPRLASHEAVFADTQYVAPLVRMGLTPDLPDSYDLPAPSPHDTTFSLIDYEPTAPDWSSGLDSSGLDFAEPGDAFDDDTASAECPDWLCEECLPCFTMRDDWDELFPTLWQDTCSIFTWENAAILSVAAGVAVAIRDNLDGEVREYTAEYPIRWGTGSKVLRDFGEFSYQLPVLFGLYGVSLWAQDEKLHEFSKAVLCAYGVSALATVTIKAATNTQRPTNQFQDGEYGFPSYHAASTFAIAAVVDEYYGWPLGFPCYVLAGLVGWSRIDQREHDLSDVVFGSVLGFVVGKSVAGAHLERYGNYKIYPYYDPVVRGVGLSFSTEF